MLAMVGVTIQRTASALNCNAHGLRFATVGAKPTSTGRRAPPCRIGFADAKYALWHILNAVYVRIAHMASIGVPASQVFWAVHLSIFVSQCYKSFIFTEYVLLLPGSKCLSIPDSLILSRPSV